MSPRVDSNTARRTDHPKAPQPARPTPRPTTLRAVDGHEAAPKNIFAASPFSSPLASLFMPPPPPPGLTIGAQGRKVAQAEKMLAKAGFDTGKRDDKLTTKTESALKEFQSSVGLEATGRLDNRTFAKLERVNKAQGKHPEYARQGTQSDRNEAVEKRLRRLGYDVGRADGVFDGQTAQAVKAFKGDQPELKDDLGGVLGTRGQRSLRAEHKAIAHDPFHARKHVGSAAQRRHLQRLDERVATAAGRVDDEGRRGFGVGTRGKNVEYVQQHLKAAGFDPERTSGVFDDRTAGALRNYQRREGIAQTGRVDKTTWRHLKRATLEAKNGTDPKQMEGERSGAVRQTEELLKKLGHSPGSVDGRYTESTERAVDRFRRKHHMDQADGVGPNTLKALKKAVKNLSPFGKPQTVTAYSNGSPYSIKVVRVAGKYVEGGEPELVRQDMAKAFLKMHNAAARDGVDIRVRDGFRTMSEQRGLYAAFLNGTGNPANPPGYSEHQKGRALDLNVATNGNDAVGVGAAYSWLARNGGRFGFQRIASEAWHWEFRG